MDEDVFRGKLKQYKDTVYRIAFTYLRNQADAEDVAQETFLKFYLREKPFPDVGSEKAWLIRVTLNACHNLRRSVWFQNRAELPENLATAFETPQDNALYAAVFSLPEKYRVVILLYYYEEYSVQEISEMLQRNPSTIQTQLERARNAATNPLNISLSALINTQKTESTLRTERWVSLWTNGNTSSSWNKFRCLMPASSGF